jgi:hypothetical protein
MITDASVHWVLFYFGYSFRIDTKAFHRHFLRNFAHRCSEAKNNWSILIKINTKLAYKVQTLGSTVKCPEFEELQ